MDERVSSHQGDISFAYFKVETIEWLTDAYVGPCLFYTSIPAYNILQKTAFSLLHYLYFRSMLEKNLSRSISAEKGLRALNGNNGSNFLCSLKVFDLGLTSTPIKSKRYMKK